MKRFLNGLFIGIGIGLLIAPMRGDEMRRLLAERFAELRGYLPENEQLNQYIQQISDRISQTSSDLKDYTQQAASKVKDTGSTLGELAQKASTEAKQTSQNVAQTTKKRVHQFDTGSGDTGGGREWR